MAFQIICMEKCWVDLDNFLSDKKNYLNLMKIGMQEVFRRTSYSKEDAEDIAAESLGNLLDYYQRKPEKLMELESKEYDEMLNYLKKSIKNQTLNIIKKNYKIKIKELQFVQKLQNNDPDIELPAVENPGQIMNCSSNKNLQKDIFKFIEVKYKSQKWQGKKEAIELYIKRVAGKKTISQMQVSIPEKNLASLNTQAHRIFRSYNNWLKKTQKKE